MILTSNPEPLQGVQYRDHRLFFVDQTRLPLELRVEECRDLLHAMQAIQKLEVRGAPAIATFAGYALALEVRRLAAQGLNTENLLSHALHAADSLTGTRPTAVNLSRAMTRIKSAAAIFAPGRNTEDLCEFFLHEAQAVEREDRELCARLGMLGSELIGKGSRIMTICNTGALTTAGIGTAIGAFYTAHGQDKDITVFACETRPLLQGARLTAWELDRAGIRTFLVTDNMAAHILREEKVDLIMAGADRIARNGDTANKIGTMGLAILAKHFGIPFYIVAPTTTVDPGTDRGDDIHIEERNAEEVRVFQGARSAMEHIPVRNPAFDVTPAALISAIVTERGIFRPPYNFSV